MDEMDAQIFEWGVEAGRLHRALDAAIARAEAAERRIAELEARLAEAEAQAVDWDWQPTEQEWRPKTERPEHGQHVQIIVDDVEFLIGDGWYGDGFFFDPRAMFEWRPLPPATE